MSHKNGIKIYDSKWFLEPYNLNYQQAAELLLQQNTDFILTQNHFLPMPNTAVDSEITAKDKERFATYQDEAFRQAVAQAGIEYYMSCLMFFDPDAITADPTLTPIADSGLPMQVEDWYIGIAPTQTAYITSKIERILQAVTALQPDGIHLGFMRWPGFWELYLPHSKRSDFNEYSFDQETIESFITDNKLVQPNHLTHSQELAEWILTQHASLWYEWKCSVVYNVIYKIADKIKQIKPDIKVILNTLPFADSEYDGAMRTMFGQDLAKLAEVVDIFEIMAYHQIIMRDIEWPATIANHVKSLTNKEVIVTLQAKALYLDGMHKQENRNPEISLSEFKQLVQLTRQSKADGCVFFQWTDFLEQIYDDDRRFIDVITNS